MTETTPSEINFKTSSLLLISFESTLSIFSLLYFLDVVIKRYVIAAETQDKIKVTPEIEFVWITAPAKTGSIPHEITVKKLL